MPILATAEEVLVDEINVENKLALKVTDVLFGEPYVPATPDELLKANGHNSVVRIQALATAAAIGFTYVYYDRVDFTEMFTDPDGISPLRVPARLDSVFTAHDIVKLINQYYGLCLKTVDVENTTIDRSNWQVLLKASSKSLGWIGEQVVQLLPGDALIPSNFDKQTVEAYSYPHFNTRVGQGAIYSYPWRFDNFAAELKAGGTNLTMGRLAQILKIVTGDAWIEYRNPVAFNLKECVVVYNGPNNATMPTNPSVDNIVVIELSLYCLNLGGRLYLHYNDPD